jgi:hypothetical protein
MAFTSIFSLAQTLVQTQPAERYVQRDLPISQTLKEHYDHTKPGLNPQQLGAEWEVYKTLMSRLTDLVKNRTGQLNNASSEEIAKIDEHLSTTLAQMVMLNSRLAFRHSSVRHWVRQLAYIDYRIEQALKEAKHGDPS